MPAAGGLPTGSEEVLAFMLAQGRGVTEPEILAEVVVARGAPLTPPELFCALERLEAVGWVVWSAGGNYDLTSAGAQIAAITAG